MKTIASFIILVLYVAGVNAQSENNALLAINDTIAIAETKTETTTISEEDDICYGEESKAAYYEALIRQNDLKIELKNTELVLRNTEDLINKSKYRISYAY